MDPGGWAASHLSVPFVMKLLSSKPTVWPEAKSSEMTNRKRNSRIIFRQILELERKACMMIKEGGPIYRLINTG